MAFFHRLKINERYAFLLLFVAVNAIAWWTFGRWNISHWDELAPYLTYGPVGDFSYFDAQWSDLYRIWYWFLSLFAPLDPIRILNLNFYLLPVGIVSAWYILLRQLDWKAEAAALSSIAVAFSPLLWSIGPFEGIKVYHFAFLGLLVALVGYHRLRDPWARAYYSLVASFLLVFCRPEYFVMIPVAFCVGLWQPGLRRSTGKFAAFLVLGIALLSSLAPLGVISGEKTLYMFGLNSFYRSRDLGLTTEPSWIGLHSVMKRNYGGATSVPEAALNNPGEFLRQIAYNLKAGLPEAARVVGEAYYGLPSLYWALSALALVTVLWLRPRWTYYRRELLLSLLFLLPVTSAWVLLFLADRYLVCLVPILSLGLKATGELPKKARVAAFFAALVLGLISLPAWRNAHAAHTAAHVLPLQVMKEDVDNAVPGPFRMITNCGSLWVLFPQAIQNESANFILLADTNIETLSDYGELMRKGNYDVFAFCDVASRDSIGDEGIRKAERELVESGQARAIPSRSPVFRAYVRSKR